MYITFPLDSWFVIISSDLHWSPQCGQLRTGSRVLSTCVIMQLRHMLLPQHSSENSVLYVITSPHRHTYSKNTKIFNSYIIWPLYLYIVITDVSFHYSLAINEWNRQSKLFISGYDGIRAFGQLAKIWVLNPMNSSEFLSLSCRSIGVLRE